MLNGRIVGDLMGFYTFLHDSHSNYIIAPESIFYNFFFNVQLHNDFSDHCPIWFGLDCRISQIIDDDSSIVMPGKFIGALQVRISISPPSTAILLLPVLENLWQILILSITVM